MNENVEKVKRALKAAQEVNQLLQICARRGSLPSEWMVNAGALTDGLLALAKAARAVVAMEFYCPCGAVPWPPKILHTANCPIGVLAAMTKESTNAK